MCVSLCIGKCVRVCMIGFGENGGGIVFYCIVLYCMMCVCVSVCV